MITKKDRNSAKKKNVAKSRNTKKRPALSAGEQALEMLKVQNTMSKHAYYHAKGFHMEELEDIWVKEDGPYASTASFTQPMHIKKGLPVIKKFYAIDKLESSKKNLEEISRIYPEIKNVEENLGIGSEWAMHTQTTPIIEVAGDGKTAKGIWYSPGIGLVANYKDGSVWASGILFCEAYGSDFVKEDGIWKIWHIQMYYDFVSGLPESMTDMIPGQTGSKPAGPMEMPEMTLPEGAMENPDPYQSWSPITRPDMLPRFPEPYYTFSETFSY